MGGRGSFSHGAEKATGLLAYRRAGCGKSLATERKNLGGENEGLLGQNELVFACDAQQVALAGMLDFNGTGAFQ